MNRKERNRLDKIWKSDIRRLWSDKCAVCGKSNCKLDCHHLISRTIPEFRHDNKNGILLCSGCHLFSKRNSAHSGSLVFHEWLRVTHPDIHNYLLNKLKTI